MDAKAYLASLAKLQDIRLLESDSEASKSALLAAEVSLPLASCAETASLRVVQLRLLLVDVSRLPAP
jgi:hypothetical protein